jgi:hypothetical protein
VVPSGCAGNRGWRGPLRALLAGGGAWALRGALPVPVYAAFRWVDKWAGDQAVMSVLSVQRDAPLLCGADR